MGTQAVENVDGASAEQTGSEPPHPLAPLTHAEIARVVSIVRRYFDNSSALKFETIELREPEKTAFWAATGDSRPRRVARANVFQLSSEGVTRLIIDLDNSSVLSKTELPDAQPMIQPEQFLAVEDSVRLNPLFIAGCARRGITDMSTVCVDPWSAGRFDLPDEAGRHLSHVFAWQRMQPNENFYAHPIEGLNAVVDIKTGAVIRVDDYGIVPIPQTQANWDRAFVHPRKPMKPIDVVQPDGVSFSLDGHQLTWSKWSVVLGYNAREALTLHDLRYDGRSIVYRASIAEMTVPYGSPLNGHFRKHVFDIGEYGLGKLANSLTLGCDCLGAISYLDAHLNTIDGAVMTIENAICIHEEDAGLLWKHTDFRTERTETRRSRRLVISTICTVGNYDYGLYWYLYLDGTIECEIKATGIVNTAACKPGHPGKYAREVLPGVAAQIHQHIFCARLDMAIDGTNNTVVEGNTYAEPIGPANPNGNAFYEEETVLRSEHEGARRVNPATHRNWTVINPGRKNHVGTPVGYRLHTPHCVTPFVDPKSPSGRRAGFVQNHVWVTAFDSEQRYPAGEYVNQSDGSGGLPDMVAMNRNIQNTDIVLWHVFGLHHPVRTEDFPVQPCVSSGFKMMPFGFFDGNPCNDLPPDRNVASCHVEAGCPQEARFSSHSRALHE